jgi:hypothetical protein
MTQKMRSVGWMVLAMLPAMWLSFSKPLLFSIQEVSASRNSTDVFEDSQIRMEIPRSWKIMRTTYSADDPRMPSPPAVPQTLIPSPGNGVLLQKETYTLTLVYGPGHHASGIVGGRFIEVFHVPWLQDVSDSWACGGYLHQTTQPVNKRLKLVNLVFDHPSREAIRQCQLPAGFENESRWFAAYFTTAPGEWFFASKGSDCGDSAYTLTSAAQRPSELPQTSDGALKKVINEVIGGVASIHYKRCPPE